MRFFAQVVESRSLPEVRATYRVQLHAGFGFDDAAAIAPYLADLGVSHLYCSPYLQAAAGSTHGYDVVDHSRLNEELGGAPAHERLVAALDGGGLGQVIDIVPNHMAVVTGNQWWWDVLENGPSSQYASYFDVDWDPPENKLRNTVLLPVLGDHYGRVLEAGELVVEREGGALVVTYHEHRFPVSPRTYDDVLRAAATGLSGAEADELASLADAFGRLPPATATDRASVAERHRDKEVLKSHLDRLLATSPAAAAAVDGALEDVNAAVDVLDVLLERQNYRLALWRTAGQELDYRRFFDVNTLIGLRAEDPQVFEDTHALVLDLVERGVVQGLRVDHPDGLRDPAGYLRRLRERAPEAWLVVEKVLEPGEELRPWPVDGTTGYDFMQRVGGLFVDPDGEAGLTEAYRSFTGITEDYAELARANKLRMTREILASDVERLTALLATICEGHRRYRDHTRRELRDLLRETIASFAVYRTYVDAVTGDVAPADVARVEEALTDVGTRRPDIDPDLLAFLFDVLLLRHKGEMESELASRFQQVTGPVMAKAVEDTTFYVYNRLVSLNEVGGAPDRFGVSPDTFHRASGAAARRWPRSMVAMSTHDTKRSEDVRARISLLSEDPAAFTTAARRWSATNERHRRGPDLPDTNAEWLLYQTLVGAWPIDVDRACAYMEKATKEAKVHTGWIDPVADYDEALRAFVTDALVDPAFTDDLAAFVAPIVGQGRVTSLAQKLVQLTAPGVPDTYQGTEVWDLSLVDPDNRRPVDYGARAELLAAIRGATAEEVLARTEEGAPKLHVVQRALAVRARHPDAFGPGSVYEPLLAEGAHAHRVVAFSRGSVVTVVPRLVLGLDRAGGWGDTVLALPAGEWVDELTGTTWQGGAGVRLDELLARFPVALLVRA